MPYKDRTQLNIKLTATERAQLEEEASLAGVTLHTYTRHLLLQRPVQPLSVQAEQLQLRYRGRDEAMMEKFAELNAEKVMRLQLQQRVQELEVENQQLLDPEYLGQLIQGQLKKHFPS